MAIPFFFAAGIALASEEMVVDEDTSKHIVQVLRMQPGENILLTDGCGHSAKAEILQADKRQCIVRRLSVSYGDRSSPQLTIAISLTKNQSRFEWFLEKATELGTAAVVPMLCKRTEKQRARTERMVSICKSAMLQSHQVWMPLISPPTPFDEAVRKASQEQKLFGHIDQQTKKLTGALDASASSHIILIGPEGDFSPEEVGMVKAAGFEGVSFGRTILRVETAGLYAAAVHAACM